uniref:Exonuclease domain-containing protein n=1 Tax=Oryza punctata TaxID=4537 RepID=A0A0E0KCN1_ORYPU
MSYTNCLRRYPVRAVFPYTNAILRASLEKGSPEKSLTDYNSMRRFTAFCPDYRTYVILLKACAKCSNIYATMEIHSHLIKLGLLSNQQIVTHLFKLYIDHDRMMEACTLFWLMLEWSANPLYGNLMLMGFLKCGQIDKAYQIFKRMPVKDLVSWNSMIAGTARNSYLKDAMNIFSKLINSGLLPDGFSFSSVLSACAQAGARCYGMWVHQLMAELGLEMNHILNSSLVDMYAKCGRIDVAIGIFKTIKRNHVSVWNTMIGGLAAHGLGSDAVMFFREMESEGLVPDGVTFVALLTACSHCGMVEEARQYFEAMTTKYSITPRIEHYGAMVDTLSRAGLLDEAYDLVKSMNVKPDAVIWRALLSACCRYRQTKVGEITVKEIAFQGCGDYTLLSNIYSSANRWEDSEEVWKERKKKGIRKSKGLSWVELGGSTHEFKAGDRSHPDTDGIYQVLHRLSNKAKSEGYIPLTELVLKDVSEEEREENLTVHSEKLAVAYSILKTIPRTEIMVSKNLQTCSDCHEWMKIVSKADAAPVKIIGQYCMENYRIDLFSIISTVLTGGASGTSRYNYFPLLSHGWSMPIYDPYNTWYYHFAAQQVSGVKTNCPATILVFDIETTGFSRRYERIIEFAVRDLMGGKNSTIQTLINPERDIKNTYVHGISSSMVCKPDIPRFREFIPVLLQYVLSRQMADKPVLWVAHNGRNFDVPFLMYEFQRSKIEMPGDWLFVDTRPIAKQLIDSDGSKLKSVSLDNLRVHYKIPLAGSAHRAMQDVITLCYVLQKLTFELKLTVPQLLERSFRVSDLATPRPGK